MTIKIGILNETDENESRAAATPQISQLLNKLDVAWVMESGAGVQAGYPDSEYTAQKFTLLPSADAVFAESDITLHIAPATLKKADAPRKILADRLSLSASNEVLNPY
jgi:H+-translocating NAD(P) transhydrogenase subunit alpha